MNFDINKTTSSFDIKETIPYLTSIFVFILIGFLYFSPQLKGKVLNQHDKIQSYKSLSEIEAYEKNGGEKV